MLNYDHMFTHAELDESRRKGFRFDGVNLCRGLLWYVSAIFTAGKFRWKSQSRRNGIWA